jgi:putative ABC transport system permease protein
MKSILGFLRPRWRKVLADLSDNKMRTLMVVASIAVGAFAVGTITTAYAILSEDINASFASAHPANIEIVTDPFEEEFIRSVEKVPGVADAEGRHILGVRASLDGETWQSLDLVAYEDFEKPNINLLAPLEGASIPDSRQLLIGRDRFKETGFQVGDVLQIQLPDDTIRTMPVVGIVRDQTTGVGDFMAPPLGYIAFDTLEWLGRGSYYNRLQVTVSGDSNDEEVITGVSDAVKDKIEKNGLQVYQTRTNKTNEHPMASTVLAVIGVLGALGLLIMLLSSSLIVNTLNALLTQHLRQIGVMKLVGARSLQILGMYLILILSYGIIALIIAVPLGVLAGNGLANFLADFLKAKVQEFRVVPVAILLQVLIALIVPLVAGFVPVNSGSKTTVRRAISNNGPGQQAAGSRRLDRLGNWFSWLSRPVLLSIRNTFRRQGRLALTLFTLTIGGAIFIAVFNVRASMEQFMDQLGQHFRADITLNFAQPYRFSRVEQAVYQVPGVEHIEGWAAANADILGPDDKVEEDIYILAPPANSSLLDPEIVAGRWLVPADQKALTVSDSIWDLYPDLQPGDTLRLNVQGRWEDDWMVVGVFRFSTPLGDTLAYANYDMISDLFNMPDKASSYRVVTELHTLEGQEQVGKRLDQHLRAQGFHLHDVEVGEVTREQNSQGINILVIFLLIMALLTATVGSIGLTGTMGMNVLERTREIGVMRAIGAVDLAIIKLVVVEGVLIGLISWFLAVIFSFPISYLLLSIISKAMINSPMPLAFTLLGFAIWLVVVVALSVIASMLPARNAARLTIREVLAYE